MSRKEQEVQGCGESTAKMAHGHHHPELRTNYRYDLHQLAGVRHSVYWSLPALPDLDCCRSALRMNLVHGWAGLDDSEPPAQKEINTVSTIRPLPS